MGSYGVDGDGDCWFRAVAGSYGIISVDEAATPALDRQWTKLISKHRLGAVASLTSPAYKAMCDEEFRGLPGWRRGLQPFKTPGFWDWKRVAGRESTAFMAVFAKGIMDELVEHDDATPLPKIAVIERYSKEHHTMRGRDPLDGEFYLPCVWVYDVDFGNLVRPPSFKKAIPILEFVEKLRIGEAYAIVEYNGSSHFSFWRKPPVDGDDSEGTPSMAPFEVKLAAVAGVSDAGEASETREDAKLFGEGLDRQAVEAEEQTAELGSATLSPAVAGVSPTPSEAANDAATEASSDAGALPEEAAAVAESDAVPSTPELKRAAAAADAANQAASPTQQRHTRATYPLPDFGRGGAGHNQTLLTETQEIDLVTNKVLEDFSRPPPYEDAVAGIGMAPTPADEVARTPPDEAAADEPVVVQGAVPPVVDVTSPSPGEEPSLDGEPVAAADASAAMDEEGEEDEERGGGTTYEDMVGRQQAILDDIKSNTVVAEQGAADATPAESKPVSKGYTEKVVSPDEANWRESDAQRVDAATAAIKAEREVIPSTRLEMSVGDDDILKHGTVVRSMLDGSGKRLLVVVFDDLSYLAMGTDMLAFMCKHSKLTVLPGEYHDEGEPPKIFVHNYLKASTGKKLPFAFVKTPVLTDVFHGKIEYMFYAIYEPAKAPVDTEHFSPPTQEVALWSGDLVSVPGLIVGVATEQMIASSALDGMLR